MISSTIQVPSLRVLGVSIHMLQMPQVLAIVEGWIQDRDRCRFIVATGMHGLMESRRRSTFKELLNSADLFVPDGMSLVWAARLKGLRHKNRVCGSDLMWEFCRLAEQKGYKVFFYGDTEDTLQELTIRLKRIFPGLNISGVHSPPFRALTPEEDEQEVKMLNDSGADVLWVGLGLPKQEQWMFDHKERLSVPVLVGVGAAFKFVSGREARAPAWLGNLGLEWLWRLAHDPKRVWRRVLFDGPRFIIHVALEQSGLRKYN